MPWFGLAVLAAATLQLWWPPVTASDDVSTPITVAPLVRWSDADHDWLLVVDEASSELAIYDANDGRPLRRLGAADGAAGNRE